MSRCFPYPPPGYGRNVATYEALIESIKLQKENGKAKADRKKEKRAKKEKKEKKEKRKDIEKSKLQNTINESHQDFHKQLQTSVNFKEQSLPLNIKRKELPTIEQQLEKSDLTEEHGQPVDSHKPSYSSDSTQNSNKRKRDDLVEPDGSNHVKPIKIRLFKKQKGPDSIKETSCSISGRNDQQNLGINVPLVQSISNNGQRTPLVSSNRKTGIPATSTSYDRNQSVPPVSLQPKKSDVAVLHVSRQESFPIPVPTPTYRRPSEHEIPAQSPILPLAPSVLRKNDASMVSSSGRRSIDEIKVPVNNEKKKDPISENPSKVGPTRFEKKMLKKHLKYEKLIGGWVPPPLEAQVADDDDWLKGSGTMKTSRSSSLRDDVETCREMMWQPCARFLVEADVYALPYTVPF